MPGIYTYLSNICMKYSWARFQAGARMSAGSHSKASIYIGCFLEQIKVLVNCEKTFTVKNTTCISAFI